MSWVTAHRFIMDISPKPQNDPFTNNAVTAKPLQGN